MENNTTLSEEAILVLMRRYHEALDYLMGAMIGLTSKHTPEDLFLPTKSLVWPVVTGGHEAIKMLEAHLMSRRGLEPSLSAELVSFRPFHYQDETGKWRAGIEWRNIPTHDGAIELANMSEAIVAERMGIMEQLEGTVH